MKHIKHNKMFTFVYNGKQYRAKIVNYGFSYSKINIYKYLNESWFCFIYDPIDISLGEGYGVYIHRQPFYDSKQILLTIKRELDKIVEKRLKKQLEYIQYQHISQFKEDINTL